MLTVQALQDFGADTQEGLTRCMNNESFYLTMVGMLRQDTSMASLTAALQAQDWSAAFEAAHALKGVLANLAITPVLTPVSALTEALRPRQPVEYTALLQEAQTQWSKLEALLA